MASLGFTLRSNFGLLPKTEKIEKTKELLKDEYDKLIEYKDSDELKEYEELKAYIESAKFTNFKKNILDLDYKKTKEFQNEKEYIKLAKNKKIKNYFKVIESEDYKDFINTELSDELKDYLKLKDSTDNKEFSKLKKSQKIKDWLKYQKKRSYILFKQTENSTELNQYNRLKKLINSEDFKNNKTYMLDKNKFSKTDEAAKESRYNELKESTNIKWFLATKDSNKFKEIQQWKLTFEEDFTSGQIQDEKWMNSFFWGKMLINDRYVLAGDKHFYTDNKNIEINGSTLSIVTKKEQAKGKVWDAKSGFFEKDFEYTSAMLNTAHSFRQKYGKFEAKIKLSPKHPIYQAFWLKGDKILPEIDVLKFNMSKKNRIEIANHYGNDANSAKKSDSKLNGLPFTKDFFIYTLDWTKDSISWKINGVEIFSSSVGIPNEPMYLSMSAGIQAESDDNNLPAAFEIDWIKCYEKVK